jgi:hypothetical protein
VHGWAPRSIQRNGEEKRKTEGKWRECCTSGKDACGRIQCSTDDDDTHSAGMSIFHYRFSRVTSGAVEEGVCVCVCVCVYVCL